MWQAKLVLAAAELEHLTGVMNTFTGGSDWMWQRLHAVLELQYQEVNVLEFDAGGCATLVTR